MKSLLCFLVLISISFAAFASDHQCEGSCTVTVCDAGICIVYRCDTSGCHEVARYDDDQQMHSHTPSIAIFDAKSNRIPSATCDESRCATRICDDGVCVVYGFEDGEVSRITAAEDTRSILDDIIEDYIAGPASRKYK